MNNNRQILIDFDHTLFDVDKFLKEPVGGGDYSVFLYPDVWDFLRYASSCGKIVLFSEGDVDFQNEKISKSGLKNIFGANIEVYPSFTKVKALEKMPGKSDILLIDDNPIVVDWCLMNGIKVIRVKRGKYMNQTTKEQPKWEVENLSDIVNKNLIVEF